MLFTQATPSAPGMLAAANSAVRSRRGRATAAVRTITISQGNTARGTRFGRIRIAIAARIPAANARGAGSADGNRQRTNPERCGRHVGHRHQGHEHHDRTAGDENRGDRRGRGAEDWAAKLKREEHEQRAADRPHQVRTAGAKQTSQGHQQRDAGRISRHHRPIGSDSVAERREALRRLGPRQGRSKLLIDLQVPSGPQRRLAHVSRRIGRSRRPAAVENAGSHDPERRGGGRKHSQRPQQPAP